MAQKVRIDLSDEERNELQRIARSETKPFREVQRARMILYSAQGLTDAEIAERLDCTPECVGKWRRRFGEQRFAGLGDKQRAGRPRRFPPEQVAEVKAIACEVPATHGLPLGRFTRTELHRLVIERGVTDASATTIWRWLHEDAIKPWQVRSWLFARDPDFQAKAGRVLDLYAPGSPRANRSSSWQRERTCGRFASDAGANRRTGQSRRPCPDQLSPPASFPR